MRLFLMVVLVALYSNRVSAATDLNCGDPPAVTNEIVKGEVQAKADAISKILGAIGFGAAYEKSREDIFNKYDESKATRADQYLYFLVCNTLGRSASLTDKEKLDAIFQMRSVMLGAPIPGLGLTMDRRIADAKYGTLQKQSCSSSARIHALRIKVFKHRRYYRAIAYSVETLFYPIRMIYAYI